MNQELSKLPDGFAFSFSPPAIPGVGTSGGFTFVLEDRAGKDVAVPGGQPETRSWPRRSKRPEIGGPGEHVPAERAAAVRRCGPRQSAQAGCAAQRCLSHHSGLHGRTVRELLQPLRPPVAGVCRGRRRLPDQGRECRPVLRAQQRRGNGAALGADEVRIAPRPGVHHALQPVSLAQNHRRRRAGIQLRAGHEGARRNLRANHAARDGLRLHGHVVSGKEGAGRRVVHGDLRVLAAVRVSDSGGAV